MQVGLMGKEEREGCVPFDIPIAIGQLDSCLRRSG